MTVKLTNNFLANARGFTLADGGGITWSLNSNTNAITANGSGAGASGANPTAKVGLTTVNGSATTFMRSDGAPPIGQTITPTWTGLHTFGAGLTISAGAFTLNGHTLTLAGAASVSGTNTGDQTVPTGANPSGSVGLAAVNGSAATFMRSDGAPGLSQAIAPTWTGNHTFTPGSGVGITINGAAAQYGLDIEANSTSGQSFGLLLHAGSSSADRAAKIYNQAATTVFLELFGDGHGTIGPSSSSGISWDTGGNVKLSGKFAINGATPAAQVTGFGTPTGPAVVSNFSGTAATTAQMQSTIAEILTILKAYGMIGA